MTRGFLLNAHMHVEETEFQSQNFATLLMSCLSSMVPRISKPSKTYMTNLSMKLQEVTQGSIRIVLCGRNHTEPSYLVNK